jgi:DNA ligase D-like protein (predicted ligase)
MSGAMLWALMPNPKTRATFIEPMLLLRTEKLPEGEDWLYEIKFDGYRALAIKSSGRVHLRSRNDNDFSSRYPGIAKALTAMPDETVVDGEIVALDESGKPSFNALQNYNSAGATLHYYVFDLLMLNGRDVTIERLAKRRALLEELVLPQLDEPIRYSPVLEGRLGDLTQSVKLQGLEGLVAKRRDSRYEPGQRSGAWQKMRANQGQELVVRRMHTVAQELRRSGDRLLRGREADVRRTNAERIHTGVTRPAIQKAETARNQRVPLRESTGEKARALGAGLTAVKMEECRWLKPVLVGQVEFEEWTEDGHLRHCRFVGLREDKPAKDVRREVS